MLLQVSSITFRKQSFAAPTTSALPDLASVPFRMLLELVPIICARRFRSSFVGSVCLVFGFVTSGCCVDVLFQVSSITFRKHSFAAPTTSALPDLASVPFRMPLELVLVVCYTPCFMAS